MTIGDLVREGKLWKCTAVHAGRSAIYISIRHPRPAEAHAGAGGGSASGVRKCGARNSENYNPSGRDLIREFSASGRHRDFTEKG